MSRQDVTYVEKVCAYITRNGSELLVFEGPGHDGLQVPKGTVEPGEAPRDAMVREAVEESGLATFEELRHLTTDVWTRRESPRSGTCGASITFRFTNRATPGATS